MQALVEKEKNKLEDKDDGVPDSERSVEWLDCGQAMGGRSENV